MLTITVGISLYVFASVFFRVTGSIFNPSVGLALWMSGVIGTVRFVRECKSPAYNLPPFHPFAQPIALQLRHVQTFRVRAGS